jgi:aryl-alcohol dehydrogenase-like predicted oxidoreductase
MLQSPPNPPGKAAIVPEPPINENFSLDNTVMGLGTSSWGDRFLWHYGHGYTDNDLEAAFRISLEAGANLVDTAEVYGAGHSERLLGKFLKNSPLPVVVATKFFPIPYRFTAKGVIRALRGSLARLDLERVDLYQLHWPSLAFLNDAFVEGLAMAAREGLTKAVGVSNYDGKQIRQAQQILSGNGVTLASNQLEYSLLQRGVESSGMLDLCHQSGIRLIAYSPLAMGLLTGKYTAENPPPGARGRKYAGILKELPALIDLMIEIGTGHGGKTPGQVALNWIICKGALPIPGAKTAEQAGQNTGAIGWRLTPEEIHALDVKSEKII